MARVVQVGKFDDPNDKYPPFDESSAYVMRITQIEDTKVKDYFDKTKMVDRFYIHTECVDPQHPQHIGRTNRMLTNSVPTASLKNKLTQVLMNTILNGAPQDGQKIDVDGILQQNIVLTFHRELKDKSNPSGEFYENVRTIQRAGGFTGNAPVPAAQPAAPQQPAGLPGWTFHFDPAQQKWMVMMDAASGWKWYDDPAVGQAMAAQPAPAPAPAPAQQQPAAAPVQQPAPAPVQQPAPAPVAQPAPVQQPAPAPIQQPSPTPAPAPAGQFGWATQPPQQ